jgi:hypothetical protein
MHFRTYSWPPPPVLWEVISRWDIGILPVAHPVDVGDLAGDGRSHRTYCSRERLGALRRRLSSLTPQGDGAVSAKAEQEGRRHGTGQLHESLDLTVKWRKRQLRI